MKKLVILMLLCFMVFPIVIAGSPELTFQHNETQPGETMLGIISLDGEWIQGPEKSSILFFEDSREIFIEFDIVFFEENYYFYVYPVYVGEYELVIPNILYKEDDVLKSGEIEYFFNVSLGTFEDDNETMIDQRLGIKPGFLLSSEGNEIVLSNKGTDILNITYLEEIISLTSLESRTIPISFNELFSHVVFSAYKEFKIPLINLLGNETNTSLEFIDDLNLKTDTELITANITLGDNFEFNFTLFNFEDNNFTNISFSSQLDIFEFPEFYFLGAREEKLIEIEINPTNPERIIGKLFISYIELGEMHVLEIPIDFFVYPVGTSEEEFNIIESTCEELLGNVCDSNEVCDGKATFASGGVYCCLSSCNEIVGVENDSSTGMIAGIIILVILGIGSYLLWVRSKRVKPASVTEVLNIASKDFDKKIGRIWKPKKVNGKMSKN